MTQSLSLTRSLKLPDPHRLARYRRAPEVGPRLLFFSGGSALAGLSRQLIDYTHNSIHLITPFDSGGSSAALRKAFRMLAVGDLRNRLMALADQSVQGNPEIVRLFAHRFPEAESAAELRDRLAEMIAGRDPLVAAIPDPMRKIIRGHLRFFAQKMPERFDLRGASMGNLVLAGGYLNHERHIDPVIFTFSKLAEVRGVVRPVVNANLHLAARLADGSLVVGQHRLTGRSTAAIASPVAELFLARDQRGTRAQAAIRPKVARLIAQAELICYPMGSFYTSLVATLLPAGVCAAVAAAGSPKVYVPNVAGDPEQLGLDVAKSVAVLLDYLRRGCPEPAPTASLLNLVVVDTAGGVYPGGAVDVEAIRRLGVQVVDLPLVSEASRPHLDPGRLLEALLSLV
ncbi:MAG: GAK system CofD-like protein [Thermodesulfobacteriota bacterium]